MPRFLIINKFYTSKESIFAANIKIIEMSEQLIKIQNELNREFTLEERNLIGIYDGLDKFEPIIQSGNLKYKKV